VYAVDGVTLKVREGQTLGLVGESGCGKTTVGRTIARLYKPTGGIVNFEGKDLSRLNQHRMREVRRNLQMIFQDPFESLNARHTIGDILQEPFEIHKIGAAEERENQILQLLKRVGLDEDVLTRFPHEFSGGQRQRIGIARAIALKPKMVICDEPVSALDVSIQSQILNLLLELQSEMNLTYLFIAHDLAVVKHISDDIAVMYLGQIVEWAEKTALFDNPRHPYTRLLFSAIPDIDNPALADENRIKGEIPNPTQLPPGCFFSPRCPLQTGVCVDSRPELLDLGGGHLVRCFHSQ
jgi:oligopeptide/dipeptide ABC transporter ATP-binding protein